MSTTLPRHEMPGSSAPAPPPAGAARPPSLSDYWVLIRPRILGMVLFTLAMSAILAGPQPPPWTTLVFGLIGSAAVMAGAVALNQRLEHSTDARMPRTARRPVPSGRMTPAAATRFGILATLAGLACLAATTPPAAAALALLSWVLYVWVYTPMKALSAWQTPVGAIAGAMPTLMGAALAQGATSSTGLALFGILYFWQFPHAMAIAWLYRQEFAAAGLKVATVIDPSGRAAGWVGTLGGLVLVPISALPAFLGQAGAGYAAAAIALSAAYLALAVAFHRHPSDSSARHLLRVSVLYLPAVFAALLVASFLGR